MSIWCGLIKMDMRSNEKPSELRSHEACVDVLIFRQHHETFSLEGPVWTSRRESRLHLSMH
jgi:hypothetical protein